ncbi:cellulose synthase complex outer membrane protein BcsC [Enterobacter hormaechei]|uniref:cellulose synthase complex outer membrane protein BcsC n=1 Tax=Enterobacter hormaechei TaxID=158836 RepID=UPI00388FF6A1
MRTFTLNLLTLSLGLALMPLAQAANSPQQRQLLEQVRLGESTQREDLVRQSLYRLELIDPNNPDVIAARFRYLLRQGDTAGAQKELDRLKGMAPDSSAYQSSRTTMLLSTPDGRQALQQARLLATTGHTQEAIAAHDKLFDGKPPSGDIATEYWNVVAKEPARRNQAINQLKKINASSPGNVPLQSSLAQLLFQSGRRDEGFSVLQEMAKSNNGRSQASDMWYQQIKDQPASSASVTALQQYLSVFSDGDNVTAARAQLEAQQKQLADPAFRAKAEGLAAVDAGQGSKAVTELQKAVSANHADSEAVGALGQAYSQKGDRARAVAQFEKAIALDPQSDNRGKWDSLLKVNRYWLLIQQGDNALKANNTAQAERYYQQARNIDNTDSYAVLGLGDAAAARKDNDAAERYYRQALRMDSGNSNAVRGLANIYRAQSPEKATQFIQSLSASQRRSIDDIERSLTNEQLSAQAEQLESEGKYAQAAEIQRRRLALSPGDVWITYRLSRDLYSAGQRSQADNLMRQLASQKPGDPDQVYASGLYLSGNDQDRAALAKLPAAQNGEPLSINMQRRLAMAQAGLGDHAAAEKTFNAILPQAKSQPPSMESALVMRDAARFQAQNGQPKQALDTWKDAMVSSGITTTRPTDNDSFTRLTRNDEKDDWLKRGVRSDAGDLYRQQDLNVTLQHDYWGSSGTGGYSDLKAHTTMLQVDAPLSDGRMFFRSDLVNMNAGSFDTDNGTYDPTWGTCAETPCHGSTNQSANGASVAVGWQNKTWAWDIGTTPMGFDVVDVVGSLSYSNDLGPIGYTLNAHRRPISSSVLAFAGQKDPNTDTTWGGVRATGGGVSMSYDKGEANGIWSSLSADSLTGKNVEDNWRVRWMTGYYYKLINQNNERLTVGVSNMLWHYDKDLSGYSLGQGGYYSPQEYVSFALPVNWRKRTENWSWELGGSVSWSHSKTKDVMRYPLQGLIPDNEPGRYTDKGVMETGSSSSGTGYTARAIVERRVTSNWFVGLGVDIQEAKDYTPSHALLYVRYSAAGWQGDMDLPPEPLVPYADW